MISLLFLEEKVTKRHSAEQNQLSQPLLTNFRSAKISLGRLLLVGNFPLIVAGCASLATLTARQKTCASFPRLSAVVACDFDSAVFFESNCCNENAKQY